MAKKGPDLGKLVALKRQKAEQAYAVMQADITAAETELDVLQARLEAGDVTDEGYAAHSLSERHGHPARILALIAMQKSSIAQKRAELRDMKEGLKRAFHSEQRLKSL